MAKTGYIYLMTNKSNSVLYVGVTSNLVSRVIQHRNKTIPGFTDKYNLTRLVYYESCNDMYSAIAREKQIKSWSRKRKNELIESVNPNWNDIFDEIA